MVVDFDFLFTENEDGSFTNKVPFKIPGSISIGFAGVISKNDSVNGVDPIASLKGKRVNVEQHAGIYVIKGEAHD